MLFRSMENLFGGYVALLAENSYAVSFLTLVAFLVTWKETAAMEIRLKDRSESHSDLQRAGMTAFCVFGEIFNAMCLLGSRFSSVLSPAFLSEIHDERMLDN